MQIKRCPGRDGRLKPDSLNGGEKIKGTAGRGPEAAVDRKSQKEGVRGITGHLGLRQALWPRN